MQLTTIIIIGLALFASVFVAWRQIRLSSPARKPRSFQPPATGALTCVGLRAGFLKLAPKLKL